MAIFDDITRAFLATLEAGTLSLGAYSLPLLGAFALIGWYWTFGRSWPLGGGQLGDALAGALLYAVNIGVAYWLLVNLSGMATAAYQTFLQWGLAAGGRRGRRAAADALDSRRHGLSDCQAADGLYRPADRLGAMWNFSQILMYRPGGDGHCGLVSLRRGGADDDPN